MKFKALVLIGSLIAFSSCEKEEEITINMNELSLDSRLFGNWIRIGSSGKKSYSSDGRCILENSVFEYYTVSYENYGSFEGRIIYVPHDYNDRTGVVRDYHFNGDTLVMDGLLDDKWLKY